MFRRSVSGLVMFLGALALLGMSGLMPAYADGPAKAPDDDAEVKLGRENAAENDKSVKLVSDPVLLERVNRIGQEIAVIANTTQEPALWGSSNLKKFEYTFKIVADKDVNAYSLPGGFIYVNKGLLDFVHSDDELAGVLAHEVAHAAHHHMMKLISEQNRLQQRMLLPLILAAVLTRSPGQNIGNLLLAGQLYLVAKVNTYGIEAEKDADHTGILYMTKTRYNPVGMLTFMERLARQELLGPEQELGIYRTHPPSPERAQAMLAELDELKIAVHRRDVDPTNRALVVASNANGIPMADVKMNQTVIVRFAASDGATAEKRAQTVADRINLLFDGGLQMYEVRLSPDRTRVMARTQTLLMLTPEDADAQKTTVPDLAQGALTAIKNLLWQDQFNRLPAASALGG